MRYSDARIEEAANAARRRGSGNELEVVHRRIWLSETPIVKTCRFIGEFRGDTPKIMER